MEGLLEAQEQIKMSENRYKWPAWAALAMAVLFPLAWVIGILQSVVGAAAFGYHGPTFGPADFLFLLFTALGVYTYYMFRDLLNRSYDFHDIDTLIMVAIWWSVISQVGMLTLKVGFAIMMPESKIAMAVLFFSFMAVSMVFIGVVDIMIAVRLLKIKEQFNDTMKVFIYLTMTAGILEVSILLSPFSLILLPILCVVLAMIFFKEKEEIEFV